MSKQNSFYLFRVRNTGRPVKEKRVPRRLKKSNDREKMSYRTYTAYTRTCCIRAYKWSGRRRRRTRRRRRWRCCVREGRPSRIYSLACWKTHAVAHTYIRIDKHARDRLLYYCVYTVADWLYLGIVFSTNVPASPSYYLSDPLLRAAVRSDYINFVATAGEVLHKYNACCAHIYICVCNHMVSPAIV